MTDAHTDYRRNFTSGVAAQQYDERVYRPGGSAEILWRIEARILRQLVISIIAARKSRAYLDFACGTGRILSLLADLASSVTGIDVSEAMLARAAARTPGAHLLCKDITAADDVVEAQYDLITSFRFLTNAERELRAAALRRLHARLKDDGVLLVNTHGNPWSYRLVLLPYHWARDRIAGRALYGYLSRRQTHQLLDAAGFRVERVIGMGFVPAKVLPLVPAWLAFFIEDRLAGRPLIQALGLNQVFVCRKG